LLLAVPLVALARIATAAAAAAALVTVAIVVGEVRWAHAKTPQLFDGNPAAQVRERDAAAAWLASTARSNDVLLGYSPVFLRAWEKDRSFSDVVLPRADPALLAEALEQVSLPLGRGVWVFDASATTNARQLQTIPLVSPRPAAAFEARVYGPYLVIRSRAPLLTRARYVAVSERVMLVGRSLQINDADVDLQALRRAESRL